jgi:hypothetical protein
MKTFHKKRSSRTGANCFLPTDLPAAFFAPFFPDAKTFARRDQNSAMKNLFTGEDSLTGRLAGKFRAPRKTAGDLMSSLRECRCKRADW